MASFIKHRTKTWIHTENGDVKRSGEVNTATAFYVFRNTGNQAVNVNERRLEVGDEFNTSTPFLSFDDTNYKLKFANDGRSNCDDAGVAEVTITRYDIVL